MTTRPSERWRRVNLGDLFRIKHGYAFKGAFFSDIGPYVLLTPGNFHDEGGFKLKGDKEKYYIGDVPPGYVLRENDLIIAMTEQGEGLLGSSALIPESGLYLHNQRLGLIVDLDEECLEKKFLYYLFNIPAVRARIRATSSGAKVRHTSPARIYEVQFDLPPLTIQRRIVAILSVYDDLIENNTRRIAILEEMARRIYEEWFVHFRFPGHEGVRIVDSEIGPVPDGWETLPLSDLTSRITDGAHKSPKSTDDGFPMASVKDMHDWGIALEGCRKISQEDFEELVRNDCKPLRGDILIAKDGSYLKHSFLVKREVDLVLLSSIAILRPNGRLDSELFAIALRDTQAIARMKSYVSGVAVPRIVLKDFRQFRLQVPPSAIQEEWSKLVQPFLELCRRLTDKNANLRAQRDLLLPKLISGEIDVSEVGETMTEAAAE